MLRLTCGPLAQWDVISAESKRNGRVEVIETVIRRMEQGMRRWGVPVPSHEAEDEKTELALVYDDAEFQSEVDGSTGSAAAATPPSASAAAPNRSAGTEERLQA
jgi:hypothetical protein